MDINVRFEDETKSRIVEVYGCPQPEEIPNQGIVSDTSEVHKAFLAEIGKAQSE